MKRYFLLYALAFLFNGTARAEVGAQGKGEAYSNASHDQALYLQAFLDREPPQGATRVPTNEMPPNFHATAWRFEGGVYILTPHKLSATDSAPAEVLTDAATGQSVAHFVPAVIFSGSHFLITGSQKLDQRYPDDN